MNIIIIGGMKCGTTSLRELLRGSGVFFGKTEEHYFDNEKKIHKYGSYFEYLDKKYLAHDYEIFGDDTPSYSFVEGIEDLIYQDVPDAKLIFMVRDPLARAVSNYWHAVRRGAESRDINAAFEACLENDVENIWLNYIERSNFTEQYSRFVAIFPESSIHVASLEGFLSNFAFEKKRLSNFLNIPISGSQLPKVNTRSFHGNPKVNKLFGSNWNSNLFAKAFSMYARYIFRLRGDIPCLSNELRERVQGSLEKEYSFLGEIYEK